MPTTFTDRIRFVLQKIQQRFTIEDATVFNAYHVSVLRDGLARNIDNLLPDIHDELERCFPEIIPETDGKFMSYDQDWSHTHLQ